jgi:hypothetical protein
VTTMPCPSGLDLRRSKRAIIGAIRYDNINFGTEDHGDLPFRANDS